MAQPRRPRYRGNGIVPVRGNPSNGYPSMSLMTGLAVPIFFTDSGTPRPDCSNRNPLSRERFRKSIQATTQASARNRVVLSDAEVGYVQDAVSSEERVQSMIRERGRVVNPYDNLDRIDHMYKTVAANMPRKSGRYRMEANPRQHRDNQVHQFFH